jgi:hypothetical protein
MMAPTMQSPRSYSPTPPTTSMTNPPAPRIIWQRLWTHPSLAVALPAQWQIPPPPAAPGTTAAVLVDFALLLEKHVSALNGRMDDLHGEVASNHGHISKRLFPVLEEHIAHLKTTLATTTEALESKGASLLTKCNTLKNRVSTIIDG